MPWSPIGIHALAIRNSEVIFSFSCDGCLMFTRSTIEKVDSLLHGSVRRLSDFRGPGLVVVATTPIENRENREQTFSGQRRLLPEVMP